MTDIKLKDIPEHLKEEYKSLISGKISVFDMSPQLRIAINDIHLKNYHKSQKGKR